MSSKVSLTLPWPPSTNRYWRSVVVRGVRRVLISREGRAYRKTVSDLVMAQRAAVRLPGRLSVDIQVCPPDNRKRDLDNLLKALLDALQHAGVYQDDSQIDKLSIERVSDGEKGTIDVDIMCQL